MDYICRALTREQQEQLLADARAGIAPSEALVKYPASRSVLSRLLKSQGLSFAPRILVADEVLADGMLAGESLNQLKKRTGVSFARLKRVQQDLGPIPGRVKHGQRRAYMTARMVELASSLTTAEIAARLGCSPSLVHLYLKGTGIRPVTPVKPRSERTVARYERAARSPRVPKPSPIKRPVRKLPKRDPLFFFCSRKHPITPSNRVKGTDKGCLVCAKKSLSLDPVMAKRRDAMVADLLRVIEREVAELTADLRPGMEKAA